MKYAIYVSKTLRGKNTLLGFRNDLYEAIEFGANAPGPGYFYIEEVETGRIIDLDNL